MKYLSALAVVCLLLAPSVVYGQQISPNPNPVGNTITVSTSGELNATTFQNNGTIDITNAGTLTNDGWLNNAGKLANSGFLKSNSGGVLTNTGTVINYTDSRLVTYFGGTLANAGTLTNNGSLYNHGTLANYNNSMLTNNGSLYNSGTMANNGELTNNGHIDNVPLATFTNNGTLYGSGHITGSYTDHGQTKPGNSAGVMTIDGNYFKVEGSKEIELGGLFDGGGDKSLTEYDWVDVTGNVELAGTLDVSLIDGFDLHPGNEFNFLRVGGTLSGQYDDLGEGDLVGNFGGQDLFITYGGGDGNDVALFTNAVPEPTTVLIWSMLAGVGVTVRRRRR